MKKILLFTSIFAFHLNLMADSSPKKYEVSKKCLQFLVQITHSVGSRLAMEVSHLEDESKALASHYESVVDNAMKNIEIRENNEYICPTHEREDVEYQYTIIKIYQTYAKKNLSQYMVETHQERMDYIKKECGVDPDDFL